MIALVKLAFGPTQHFYSVQNGFYYQNSQKATILAIRHMLTYGAKVLILTSGLKHITTHQQKMGFTRTNSRA